MRKFILIAIIGSFVIVGCSDNTGSGPGEDEAAQEYYYRVDVPEGFTANILFSYHNNPNTIQSYTDWFESVQGLWKTDTYDVNPLSRTPYAELRINKTKKIDYTEDISGQLKAQIIVNGEAVVDTAWQLPARNASFSIGYDFLNN